MHERPKRLRVVLLTVALAAALAGCGRQKDGPPQGPGAMPVTVITLRAEPVTLVRELPGRTSAYLVAEVRPQVSGIVKARLFTEGASVKAGQALYQLDDATYRADYDVAKAALARSEATLVAARLRARRTGELVKTGVVSAQDNDNAVAALAQAEADVQSSRAALTASGVVLGHARITSPISGRIGKSAVTEGALVKAEQDAPLATVQQLDPVYVDVTQSSAELLQLKRELAEGTLEAHASLPVTIVLEDGTPLRARRHAGIFGRKRGPRHRQLPAAHQGAEPGPNAAARHVRARTGRQRRAAAGPARAAAGHRTRSARQRDRARRGQGWQGGESRRPGDPHHRRQVAGGRRPRGGRSRHRRRVCRRCSRACRSRRPKRRRPRPARESRPPARQRPTHPRPPRRSRRGRPWHDSSSTGRSSPGCWRSSSCSRAPFP